MFPPDMHLVFVVGESRAFLSRSFYYVDECGIKHACPSRMVTDGLSIPKFLWRIFGAPFASPYLAAGLVHDHYCKCSHDVANAGNLKEAKQLRHRADELFLEMLLFLGCNKVKAWAMFRGVRIGALSLLKAKKPNTP